MITARAMAGIFLPAAMGLTRWGLVALFLAIILFPHVRQHAAGIRSEWLSLAILGGLGMGLCGAPIYLAGTLTTATNIGLIYAVGPLTILMLSVYLFFPTSIKLGQLAGLTAGLVGVLIIIIKGNVSVITGLQFNGGDLLVVMGTLAFAVYSVGLKQVKTTLPPLLRLGVMAFFGAIWHLPFVAYEVFLQHDIVTLTPQIFGVAFILVFVASLGAYVSFGVVVSELGATRAGTILFLSPVYNAVLAVTLLGEVLAQYHFVGLALILHGLWLANR